MPAWSEGLWDMNPGVLPGVGWGAGPWGASSWGTSAPGTLWLLQAVAARENVIQLDFSDPVYFSGILDDGDASDPTRYAVSVVPSTGYDGNPARPVAVVSVALSEGIAPVVTGRFVDVMLDRAMSPYPARYIVAAQGIYDATQSYRLDPVNSSITFDAVYRSLTPDLGQAPPRGGDFANPSTLKEAAAVGLRITSAQLGTYQADDSGDYALDSGIVSFKKRCIRRALSTVDAFLHLSGYGVGVRDAGKRLATSARVGQITTQMEKQIALEPEAAAVKVDLTQRSEGLFFLAITVKLRSGSVIKFGTEFQPGK